MIKIGPVADTKTMSTSAECSHRLQPLFPGHSNETISKSCAFSTGAQAYSEQERSIQILYGQMMQIPYYHAYLPV